MKRLPVILIFLNFLLFPVFVPAQEISSDSLTPQEKMEEAVLRIKSDAYKALTENARLKNDNEDLLKNQFDLQQQVNTLEQDLEQAARSIGRDQSMIQRIEQNMQRAETYFLEAEEKLKASETQLQGLEQKLAYAREKKQNLQEEIDRLQAQGQKEKADGQAAQEKRAREEISTVIQNVEALEKESHALKAAYQESRQNMEQIQKAAALIKSADLEAEEQNKEILLNLSGALGAEQGSVRDPEKKEPSGEKEIRFEELVEQLRAFSLEAQRAPGPGESFSGGDDAQRRDLAEKNNSLIDALSDVEEMRESLDNDLKRLAQEAESLAQLSDRSQKSNDELKAKIAELKSSHQEMLSNSDPFVLKAKNFLPQEPVRREIVLKEQATVLAEQNQKLLQELGALELKKQKVFLGMEKDLERKINAAQEANKILRHRLADLHEKIARVQGEKYLLESLLKRQKQDVTGTKVSADVAPARSFHSPGSARTLWKVPKILQEQ